MGPRRPGGPLPARGGTVRASAAGPAPRKLPAGAKSDADSVPSGAPGIANPDPAEGASVHGPDPPPKRTRPRKRAPCSLELALLEQHVVAAVAVHVTRGVDVAAQGRSRQRAADPGRRAAVQAPGGGVERRDARAGAALLAQVEGGQQPGGVAAHRAQAPLLLGGDGERQLDRCGGARRAPRLPAGGPRASAIEVGSIPPRSTRRAVRARVRRPAPRSRMPRRPSDRPFAAPFATSDAPSVARRPGTGRGPILDGDAAVLHVLTGRGGAGPQAGHVVELGDAGPGRDPTGSSAARAGGTVRSGAARTARAMHVPRPGSSGHPTRRPSRRQCLDRWSVAG